LLALHLLIYYIVKYYLINISKILVISKFQVLSLLTLVVFPPNTNRFESNVIIWWCISDVCLGHAVEL